MRQLSLYRVLLSLLLMICAPGVASANMIVVEETLPFSSEPGQAFEIIPFTFSGGALSVTVDAATTWDFEGDGNSEGNFDSYLYIGSFDGTVVAANDDYQDADYDSQIEATFDAGNYFLAITHWAIEGISTIIDDEDGSKEILARVAQVEAAFSNHEDYRTNNGSATYSLSISSKNGTVGLGHSSAHSVPELSTSGGRSALFLLLAGAALLSNSRRRRELP